MWKGKRGKNLQDCTERPTTKSRIKTERSKTILQRAGKLLLQERIHINHVIRDRLKNSIEQFKGKILESITPEEFHLVEKIHQNSCKKSSRQLTHIETDLLAKGLNFSITSKTLSNKDIIATTEDAVKDLEK